jgi:RNA polymerase sigma factor (sigma-70 family)
VTEPQRPEDCLPLARAIAYTVARRCRLDAGDVAQDAMLNLIRVWPTYDDARFGSRKKWAYVVLRNSARDAVRTASREAARTARLRDRLAAAPRPAAEAPDAAAIAREDAAAGRAEAAAARRRVARLPPLFRDAIRARAGGLTGKPLAAALGTTQETARWRVFKARQMLAAKGVTA